MYDHGERIYVQVDFADKKAFRELGGRYGHVLTPFHQMDNQMDNQTTTSQACCWTSSTHEIDADPTHNDCCTYHDRDYTLFYTPEQARNLKSVDKSLFWKAWYWSNAPVRDDLEFEPEIRQHLAAVHAQSPFACYPLDVPTYLNLRQQAHDTSASFSYENPNAKPPQHQKPSR